MVAPFPNWVTLPLVHFCTPSLCWLDAEMINTKSLWSIVLTQYRDHLVGQLIALPLPRILEGLLNSTSMWCEITWIVMTAQSLKIVQLIILQSDLSNLFHRSCTTDSGEENLHWIEQNPKFKVSTSDFWPITAHAGLWRLLVWNNVFCILIGEKFWLLSTAEPCGGTAECRPSLTRIWNDITQLLVLPDTSRLSSFGGFQFSKGGRDPEFETKSLIWTFYETSQCWRKDLL